MPQRPRTRRGLATWLASTTTPVFLLDDRRRVLFFNTGCERLSGWEAGDVIGQVCDFVSEPDTGQVESLTGTLCPPPEVYEGIEQSVPAFVLHRSGEKSSQLVRFFPLINADGRVERVLGTFSPVPQPTSAAADIDHQLHAELAALRSDLKRRYDVSTLVGQSRSFHRLLEQVQLAGQHAASLHLVGEPGTGKEHIARLVHYHGESRRQAFVPLDCQRLSRSELKSAVKQVLRDALDEDAPRLSPGTLFLKHVEQLPDSVQELLLEESSTAFGGGDRRSTSSGLRLMSSSEIALDTAVQQDQLNEDVFYLLTSQQIVVLPLRERPEDVLLLAQHSLESLNRDQDSQVTGFAADVERAFRKYTWPGNQDELTAVVTEARQQCERATVTLSDLPFRFRAGQESQTIGPIQPIEIVPLKDRLDSVEREHIELALKQAGNIKSQAAKSLGITRARLYRRMEQLGLIDFKVESKESMSNVEIPNVEGNPKPE